MCAVEKNLKISQWYFDLSLAVFISVTVIYFLSNRKGIITVIFCFAVLIVPTILHSINGAGNCDFISTNVAKWLFYFSLCPLAFQIVSWIIRINKSKPEFR